MVNFLVLVLEGILWGIEILWWIEMDDIVYIKNKDFFNFVYECF